MPVRTLETEQLLPRPIDEVFAFFADAGNLERITPAFLRFRILTPSVEMREGALIEYSIRLRGVPIRWRTRITRWDPPHCFVDEQIRGPYRLWRHTHRFEPSDDGTLCRDLVEYRPPFDWLVHAWLVRPDLERIFAFRAETMTALFPARAAPALV